MTDNKLLNKLKYKDDYRFLVINPPEDFLNRLQGINFALHPEGNKYAIALVFVTTLLDTLNIADTIISSAEDDCIMWFAYPKLSGKIKSDITRDKGWEILLKKGVRPVSQISIDDTWSALRFRSNKHVGHPKNK